MVILVSPCKKSATATGKKELSFTPLERHPASSAGSDIDLQAQMRRAHEGRLDLQFRLRGNIGDVSLPDVKASRRSDGLWRRTCFEAFIMKKSDDAYWEVNLSPSKEWAVYRFSSYRTGMHREDIITPPIITISASPTLLELTARFVATPLTECPAEELRINLATVVEHTTGEKSYWAIRHSQGAPDFHHSDCFVGAIV
ncbi:DOMON-like domain-containing protein [Hyphococcus luteus]|uniref:DOMON-like domain-containing protein n=1 Tax=Hyphococcus luteus TaxID=2058213 RepID=UPI0013FD1F34|nr:DOMON-like domain-containing protein [Marinicaulis flavus]